MNCKNVAGILAVVMVSASAAYASNVRTDYDHTANFPNYRTFSWGRVSTSNPLNEERAKADIQRDLRTMGWQLVPSGGAATVVLTDSVKNEQELETIYDGMGGWVGGWGWGGWGGFGGGFGPSGFGDATTQVENQRVNHLVLDIFSSSSHKLLFRGVADGDLSNNSEKNRKSLGKDLQEMFRKFPAGDKH